MIKIANFVDYLVSLPYEKDYAIGGEANRATAYRQLFRRDEAIRGFTG